jgi:hypothetical protein
VIVRLPLRSSTEGSICFANCLLASCQSVQGVLAVWEVGRASDGAAQAGSGAAITPGAREGEKTAEQARLCVMGWSSKTEGP